MLLDLTRHPMVILPDECPSSIVLRTISANGTSGIVYQESARERVTKPRYELPPTEQLMRGRATYLETRLPLYEAREITPLASVFEMSSVLAHTVQNDPVSAWRIRLSVKFEPERETWHINAWDLFRAPAVVTCMLTIIVRNLSSERQVVIGETLPLARAKRTMGAEMPANFWNRLLEDD